MDSPQELRAGQHSACVLVSRLSEQVASFVSPARVDGLVAFDDLADHALLVDHKGDAVGEADERNEHVVPAGDNLLFITEDGERDAEGRGEGFVLLAAVYANANDLRAGLFELGDITLIRLEFARSAAGEGFDVEGQHHTFLATKIGELDGRAVLVRQGEIGGSVADLEGGLSHSPKC
jgi:hypothetical protein